MIISYLLFAVFSIILLPIRLLRNILYFISKNVRGFLVWVVSAYALYSLLDLIGAIQKTITFPYYKLDFSRLTILTDFETVMGLRPELISTVMKLGSFFFIVGIIAAAISMFLSSTSNFLGPFDKLIDFPRRYFGQRVKLNRQRKHRY